jgi:hypothetical protein
MSKKYTIDRDLAYKILKEWLLEQKNIKITDDALSEILEAWAYWNKAALVYLETSSEIQKLFELMDKDDETYTITNYDRLCRKLKNNTSTINEYVVDSNQFASEDFIDMVDYLSSSLLQLQTIDAIFEFINRIKKNKLKIEKNIGMVHDNQLSFVIQVMLQPETWALIYELYMGIVPYIDEDDLWYEDEDYFDEDDDNSRDDKIKDDGTREDNDGSGLYWYKSSYRDDDDNEIDMSNFTCIWRQKESNKHLSLTVLKNISNGESLSDFLSKIF